MTISDIRRCLCGKLKLKEIERGRHTHYFICLKDQKIPLPTIVCVSRGVGEAPRNLVGGLSSAFGMRTSDFESMTSCNICAQTWCACLCVRMLSFCAEKSADHRSSPTEVRAVIESLELLIDNLTEYGHPRLSPQDKRLRGRLIDQCHESLHSDVLGHYAKRITACISGA